MMLRLRRSVMQLASLWGLLVVALGACGVTADDVVPVELKKRVAGVASLTPNLVGKAGPRGSIGAAVHAFSRELRGMLAPLSTLDAYLQDGGELDRDVSLVIALEPPPHVSDLATRYRRGGSRLDVERFGDHAFFYLQVPLGGRYQPDTQITEKGMLIDGSSLVAGFGRRAQVTSASGRADPHRGYMRVHFNNRSQDLSAVHQSVHIDYQLERPGPEGVSKGDYLVYSFFRRQEVPQEDGQLLGVVFEKRPDGQVLMVSESRGGRARWRWRAAFTAQGTLKVIGADGKLAACYDSSGVELGNAELPEPCDAIDGTLASAPKISGIFP